MPMLSWPLIAALATTGIVMALVSCLVGMPPRVENPAWWGVYVGWVAVVLMAHSNAPFLTILVASGLAGLLHGTTRALLLDQYRRHNPWHADRTQGQHSKLAVQFVVSGVLAGTPFLAAVGALVPGRHRLFCAPGTSHR